MNISARKGKQGTEGGHVGSTVKREVTGMPRRPDGRPVGRPGTRSGRPGTRPARSLTSVPRQHLTATGRTRSSARPVMSLSRNLAGGTQPPGPQAGRTT